MWLRPERRHEPRTRSTPQSTQCRDPQVSLWALTDVMVQPRILAASASGFWPSSLYFEQ
jgi:hypothetical protein